ALVLFRMSTMRKGRVIIGWREWLALTELHVDRIKAKVDTGARTSALQAEEVEYVRVDVKTWVNFVVHPEQHSRKSRVIATALLLEQREVRSSNGKEEVRPVIETTVRLGALSWLIEVTLTRRDVMGFRMLLGRQ